MRVYPIDTGLFKLDGGAMFGVVPKSMWAKLLPADENNMCPLAMRSILIDDGKRLILIDTGIGQKQSEKFFARYHLFGEDSLKASLSQIGILPSDITDVVLTHLHFDHCGGAVDFEHNQPVTAFPNATYWSNETHWKWASAPNDREKASFLKENIVPIKESGQLKFLPEPIDALGQILPEVSSNNLSGLSFLIANGHTKAMMLPKFNYRGRTIVFMADLLPTIAHVPLPYVMSFDMFPLTTLEERKSFWNEAADNEYVLILQHDAANECCTLKRTEKGIVIQETFLITEI